MFFISNAKVNSFSAEIEVIAFGSIAMSANACCMCCCTDAGGFLD